jgi:hypothetical protein
MAGAAPVARVKLGDEANGFIAEAVVSSSTDAAEWLRGFGADSQPIIDRVPVIDHVRVLCNN